MFKYTGKLYQIRVARVTAVKESFFTFLQELLKSESHSQELCMLKGAVQGNQCNGVCGFGGQDLAGIVSSLGSA